jgi:hypothetical protein
MQLKTAKKGLSEYDCLVTNLKDKNKIFEEKDSLSQNTIQLERQKNSNFQTLLDNRNQRIKSIKIQRNVLGIVTGVVIILAIL